MPSRINVATREVESIRVSANARGDGRNLARLEIRLASLVPFQIYSKDKTLNLVFERAPEAAAAQAAQHGAEVAAAAPRAETPAPAAPRALGGSHRHRAPGPGGEARVAHPLRHPR